MRHPVGHTFVSTDANGLYSLAWVQNGTHFLQLFGKAGYRYAGPPEHELRGIPVMTNGDTRLDIEFVRC